MIVVNIWKIVAMSLREGETLDEIESKLLGYARAWICRDFGSYKKDNKVPADISFNEFITKLKADPLFSRAHLADYSECLRKHRQAYLGEMAMHYLLGNDWRLVFKFNDLEVAHLPDGYICVDGRDASADMASGHFDVEVEEHPYHWPEDPTERALERVSYNLKTSAKNMWGLTVYARYPLLEDYYILAHYRAGFIRLVGYTSRGELERHARSKFGKYDMPREQLHPIEYFTTHEIFDGLKVYCGSRWDNASKFLP